MKKALTISVFILTACFSSTQAQRADSLFLKTDSATLESLTEYFTHEDSLAIFDLIDSLLKAEPEKDKSQMAVRIGYNSNIVADNSTFNISQFGLAPGISYYHKSGAYADFTTYWSKEYQPNFYLNIASAGYLHTFNKWYSILGEYSHYFYNQPNDSTVYIPYKNNIGITNYFEFKSIVFRLDYYLYFGDKTAHRIMPSLGVNLTRRKWLGFDRISFYPNLNVLYGTEEITEQEVYPLLKLLLIRAYNQNHPDAKLKYYSETTHTAFGVMNYSLSAPISFTKKDWTFLLSYNYNIPKSLQGEDTSLQNGGYVSFSITRYFAF
ncbi:MAG: hypothetical protein HOP08_16245 [Cyclobacteriaceae bacterium]|nr:hypothetical protein [Cyclobacteriaceae bacterium]